MPDYLLAHDLGTSGNKATLYTTDGQLVASRTCPYGTRYFHGNWAEQDPADWWEAICRSTRELLEQLNARPGRVAAVALSGQMMGCTPVDAQGTPLRPSILYCDQRAEAEAAELVDRVGAEAFYAITGHRVSPCYTIEKLMWLKTNEPEVYAKTAKTLCAKDYINFKLTGRMATDYSDASGTNAFDLNAFRWSDSIIAAAGVRRDLFPEPLPSSSLLGTITAEAAAATGLVAGTPVALGGGDGSCATVGVGSIRPVTAYCYLGSSAWIGLTTERPIVDPQMRTMNWAHCVPGLVHPSGSVQTAGASYRWLRETLAASESAEARAQGCDPYEKINALIAQSAAGSHGMVFLPYMLGERSPHWNPNARGAWVGMNLATTRADVFRSVMEGITMNLATIAGIFRRHVPIDSMRVIGGGVRSALWRQMMADMFGCRIEKLRYLEEATSMGAAVVGGVAAGVFADFSVIERFIAVDGQSQPDPQTAAVYSRMMPVFEKCYASLVGVYDDLARLQRDLGEG